MRVFEKDGRQVTTGVPAEAVRLIAEGYEEITDELEDPVPSIQRYEAGGTAGTRQAAQFRQGEQVRRPPNDERNHAPD